MRIRIGKKKSRKNSPGSQLRFAFLPKRLSNGTIVWLETYRRLPYYGYCESNAQPQSQPRQRQRGGTRNTCQVSAL